MVYLVALWLLAKWNSIETSEKKIVLYYTCERISTETFYHDFST